MGNGATRSRRKNKVRQNVLIVGSLQANANRTRNATVAKETNNTEGETKPYSLVDIYEVNDSLLLKDAASELFVPYYKAWLIRVNCVLIL